MSSAALWREPPRSSPWGHQRRQQDEALADEASNERTQLAQAERNERYLVGRVLEHEEAGRPIPERLTERLDDVRERICWILLRLEEIEEAAEGR
ncbi:MAG: hypothetical protein ACLQVI_27690 [Polyangiaceae bacterium]